MKPYRLEACVETLSEAVTAAERGAHQLELCADLNADGLTPDPALTAAVLAAVSVPVKVMIRPRAGDFVFNELEIQVMYDSIAGFLRLGIDRFVIGMAAADGTLAVSHLQALCAAHPRARFTLHKVIDGVPDPVAGVRAINNIPNLDSILTSGGAPTALAGAAMIARMRAVLHPRKHLIAAGRITADNLEEVRARIRVPVYHGRRIVGRL